jgi:hypothetical protein
MYVPIILNEIMILDCSRVLRTFAFLNQSNMGKEYDLKSCGLRVSFYKNQPKSHITDCKMLNNWLWSHPSRDIEKFDSWDYTANEGR